MLCYWFSQWQKNLISLYFYKSVFSPIGALWVLVEVLTFSFPGMTKIIQDWWVIFPVAGLLGFLYSVVIFWPKQRFKGQLRGRDVQVELVIGNLFDFPGALIVGTNTTFDTALSNSPISETSVQGQFTKKFYPDVNQLDEEIASQLKRVQHTILKDGRVGKNQRYSIGQVVQVNAKNRQAYLVAIAHLNEHGNARGKFEDLKEALAKLWVFVAERGTKEEIVTPVLGTGFSRLTEKRDEIIPEIIRSFVAACSTSAFCPKLTIVLSPADVAKHTINLEELGQFIRYICDYTQYSSPLTKGEGTEIE